MQCRSCQNRQAARASRRWYDHLLRLLLVSPFRCPYCGDRFYCWGW